MDTQAEWGDTVWVLSWAYSDGSAYKVVMAFTSLTLAQTMLDMLTNHASEGQWRLTPTQFVSATSPQPDSVSQTPPATGDVRVASEARTERSPCPSVSQPEHGSLGRLAQTWRDRATRAVPTDAAWAEGLRDCADELDITTRVITWPATS